MLATFFFFLTYSPLWEWVGSLCLSLSLYFVVYLCSKTYFSLGSQPADLSCRFRPVSPFSIWPNSLINTHIYTHTPPPSIGSVFLDNLNTLKFFFFLFHLVSATKHFLVFYFLFPWVFTCFFSNFLSEMLIYIQY